MIAIITLVLALPLGYLVRNRVAAHLAYVAVFGYLYTFQTLYLVRAWVGGDTSAFPADPDVVPWEYLAVTTAIYAGGFGLVTLGQWLGDRRRMRTGNVVDLDSPYV